MNYMESSMWILYVSQQGLQKGNTVPVVVLHTVQEGYVVVSMQHDTI
jgi:hypothetical protein